ncbi:unnamed protein product [Ectocarpus fasciculatus]
MPDVRRRQHCVCLKTDLCVVKRELQKSLNTGRDGGPPSWLVDPLEACTREGRLMMSGFQAERRTQEAILLPACALGRDWL